MSLYLNQEQIHQFNQDGFLVLERFIDPEFASRLADRFDHCLEVSLKQAFIPMSGTGDRV